MKEKRGLTNEEASNLLKKHGLNEIEDVGKISPFSILIRQVRKNFVIYLLTAAMILSFFVEKNVTAYTIAGIIAIIISIGFFQEYKAEKAIQALKKMITPVSIVIRNGFQQEIPSNQLVPGDIVVLRTGERIPADCIIREGRDIIANESLLTGESGEVLKTKTNISTNQAKPENFLYMGTFLLNSKALAEIIHTGMSTRFGKIAKLISTEEKQLPLQDKVNALSKFMVGVAIVSAIIAGGIMLLRSNSLDYSSLIEIIFVMIALAVASFPESFPVVLITTLSAGAYRMAQQNAIVNRMSVIETLGETTVICADKTGTITKGEMTVKKIYADRRLFDISGTGYNASGTLTLDKIKQNAQKHPVLSILYKGAVLCNDASIMRTGEDMEFAITGTPTEASLLVMAAKEGAYREDMEFVRKGEIPFTSERKLMSVLVTSKKESYVFTKGAPEYVISQCTHVQRSSGIFKLTEKERRDLISNVSELNAKSFRTLCIAYKPAEEIRKNSEQELIFLGIAAMEDPPREEVIGALRICAHAGINVKMITGDNKETAVSIARQIGITGKVITGQEIDSLEDSKLVNTIDNIAIFARVRPEHKLRIVNALKSKGEVVTMTGDGVNDAPALKASHIGVAMGKSGTDVSRSVADITLKDDNFSTIVHAVKEGRTIFNNMRKFVTYQLSCNYAEILIILLGIALGLPLPLLAIQILFMNMVTSDLPAITLGLNPTSLDTMDKKPRRKSGILMKDHILMLILAGSIMGIGTLSIFAYSLVVKNEPIETARTTALFALIFFEIANAYNFRSFRKTSLTRSPFVNKYLVFASIISIIATLAIIYTPLNYYFGTVPLSIGSLTLSLLPAFSVLIIFDYFKYLNEKKGFWKDIS